MIKEIQLETFRKRAFRQQRQTKAIALPNEAYCNDIRSLLRKKKRKIALKIQEKSTTPLEFSKRFTTEHPFKTGIQLLVDGETIRSETSTTANVITLHLEAY